MRDLIKKVLSEHSQKKEFLLEMASRDWCSEFNSLYPEYHFCKSAENYIKTELEDSPATKGRRKGKKIFSDFEKGLEKFFLKNADEEFLRNKLIKIEKTSPIFIEGEKEIEEATKLLKDNCNNFSVVTDSKLKEFEKKVKLYFLEDKKYSIENRLPTNYSALGVLFTKFFSSKGAFDGVKSEGHNWGEIAKNWISHSFHPSSQFDDIRPEEEKKHSLTSLDFQELARIYFSNDTVFNSNDIRNSVKKVLEGVRGQGFATEDTFEKLYLEGKKEYIRFAKDYGFVDMFGGVDFIYKKNNGMWVPIQVKTFASEPTYLISKLGCKVYVIAQKDGKRFEIDEKITGKRDLP